MHHRFRIGVVLWLTISQALVGPARADDADIAGRVGLAEAEAPPASLASCDSLPAALEGLVEPERRIDLWIEGVLTLVQTDGALWYLAVCSQPAVRVLCVTYSDNGMKLGDRVALRGAYHRQDRVHVLLDPCLASPAE
ncbi:MAG: hypothetical protein JWL93_1949 [Hyphomicrobiales bacterium]|nr:hypothetical protein [Hyphomicrobiales bacterium]